MSFWFLPTIGRKQQIKSIYIYMDPTEIQPKTIGCRSQTVCCCRRTMINDLYLVWSTFRITSGRLKTIGPWWLHNYRVCDIPKHTAPLSYYLTILDGELKKQCWFLPNMIETADRGRFWMEARHIGGLVHQTASAVRQSGKSTFTWLNGLEQSRAQIWNLTTSKRQGYQRSWLLTTASLMDTSFATRRKAMKTANNFWWASGRDFTGAHVGTSTSSTCFKGELDFWHWFQVLSSFKSGVFLGLLWQWNAAHGHERWTIWHCKASLRNAVANGAVGSWG